MVSARKIRPLNSKGILTFVRFITSETIHEKIEVRKQVSLKYHTKRQI